MSIDTNTIVSDITTAAESIREAIQAFQLKLREELTPKLSALVEKHSDVIESFRWRQYAPYFNDGDVCEFRVYSEPEILVSKRLRDLIGDAAEDLEEYVDTYVLRDFTGYQNYKGEWVPARYEIGSEEMTKLGEAVEEIEEVMSALSDESIEDAMKTVFGSDNIVTVTVDGVESEEYGDHD